MKFAITRTSNHGEGKPIDDAQPGKTPTWDRRTFKSPEEHDAKLGHREKWLERGTDHQAVTDDTGATIGIKRRLEDRDAWFVDIPDLDALMAFQAQHGDLVLRTAWSDDETPAIEIYDDYRE